MAAKIALKIAPLLDKKEGAQVLDHETNELSASDDDGKDSGDEEKHEQLLKAIKSLSSSGKKKLRTSQQRSEPNKTVSEFHLSVVKDSKQQVDLNDLIGSLNKSNEYGNLKKKLDSMQRNSGTLDVPLSKPEAQKIQRRIAYGETKKDIDKWAPTVKKNREADHLSFPLKPYEPTKPTLRGLGVNFKPRTPLEEEVAAVLRGSAHVLERSNKELTEEEEKALLTMDLEEAKERRHELQKLRALQSYYEIKCRRMKKIKSKKYHRVKRKAEKRAAGKMAGEDVQNEDAVEAVEKAERLRAMERMSLKHRNTSKWAKDLIAKGGKNADAKKLLQEQLRISRTLTEKAVESESDEEMEAPPAQDGGLEDDEHKLDTYGNLLTSEDNPWKLDTNGKHHLPETSSSLENDSSTKLHRLQPIRTEEAIENSDEDLEHTAAVEEESEDEFELQPVSLTEKSTKKTKKTKKQQGTKKKRKSDVEEVEVTAKKSKKSEKSNKTDSKKPAKEGKKAGKKKVASKSKNKVESLHVTEDTIDEETENTNSNIDVSENSDNKINRKQRNVEREASNDTAISKTKDICVDPKKIFRIEDHGNEVKGGESDSIQQKRIDIQQAFANDDVVEEFVQEKSEIEDASKPKDLDLSLPGWGAWAGAGIKPSEKKKKLFTKKADPAPLRKDKNLSHVIINEEKSKLFTKNQISSVPYPYGNHEQFERSMRNPVGKHWNTGTTVDELTKPRVSTLIGTIIEPIKATKQIKRNKPENSKKNKKGKESSGITIHS